MLRRCRLSVLHPDLKPILLRHAVLMENLSSIRNFGSNIVDGLSLLSDAIHSCTRLVDLHCPYLDFLVWKHLSNLPTLLALSIDGTTLMPRNITPCTGIICISPVFHDSCFQCKNEYRRSQGHATLGIPVAKSVRDVGRFFASDRSRAFFFSMHCQCAKHARHLKALIFPPTMKMTTSSLTGI